MSPLEKIVVSSADEQLFIDVWLTQDQEFRQDLLQYEASITQPTPLDQPATVRMKDWSVRAVDASGRRLNIMRQTSGGTGTDSLMQWILWPLNDLPVDISVSLDGQIVWSADSLQPAPNTTSKPISRDMLKRLRPMPNGNESTI